METSAITDYAHRSDVTFRKINAGHRDGAKNVNVSARRPLRTSCPEDDETESLRFPRNSLGTGRHRSDRSAASVTTLL